MTRRYYLRFAGGIPPIGDADWYSRSKESRAFTGFTKVSNFGNSLTQVYLSLVCLLRERVQRPELTPRAAGLVAHEHQSSRADNGIIGIQPQLMGWPAASGARGLTTGKRGPKGFSFQWNLAAPVPSDRRVIRQA